MPITNVASRVDWGYAPLGFFGVDERYGKRRDFQRFVAEAHRRNVAVVLDGVFGHVEPRFPYAYLYKTLGKASPVVGAYSEDLFYASTDYVKALTKDFFFSVCVHWLEAYHVDGVRYDAASQYWDEGPPAGEQGFADLAEAVRAHVAAQAGVANHYQRFFPAGGGETTLIQIAEYLTGKNPPEHVLFDTIANSPWQNQTLDAAKRCARSESGAISDLGLRIGLANYPDTRPQGGGAIAKSALQYIENHDHERFVCNYGTHVPDPDSAARRDELLLVGNRSERWFKVQPYLIGLMAAKGTPLLWQGQEFCQDNFVPDRGAGRSTSPSTSTIFTTTSAGR
jgi:1,4-alpha-glucan branching enzyme